MKHFLPCLLIALSVSCFAGESTDAPLVRVGDSIAAVRNHLGEPKIEFPLNGQLVQDYGDYVITSKNGVVTAIKKREESSAKKKASGKGSVPVAALMKQAQAGDAEARYRLGYCYHTGTGVAQNLDKAIRWYTLAARQGNMASQYNLAVIYMNGKGVERDYEQAYTWAVLAAGNGNDTLEKTLKPLLTAKQEKDGRLRAARIRDGKEPSPYGTPDSSTAVARKDGVKTSTSAE